MSSATSIDVPGSAWAEAWQQSWDAQQTGFLFDREQRFSALLDLVEVAAGPTPTVVDLACGTASITRRLLDRLPGAQAVAVDVDPGAAHHRPRVTRRRRAGAHRPGRPARPGLGRRAGRCRGRRRRHVHRPPLAARSRPGPPLPRPARRGPPRRPRRQRRHDAGRRPAEPQHRRSRRWPSGAPSPRWQAASRPGMPGGSGPPPIRCSPGRWPNGRRLFGGSAHPPSFSPPVGWHLDALRAAGFSEVGVAWCSGTDAVVAALR